MSPLTLGAKLVEVLVRRLAGHQETEEDEEEAFEDEIRTIVTAGLRDGLLEADAREMIEGVMELGDVDVSEIMTPRSEVDALNVEASWPEMLKIVAESGRTRMPVYEGALDNVLGILFVKDLLAELSKDPQSHSREHPRCVAPALVCARVESASTICCASFVARAATWRLSSTSIGPWPAS